MHLARDWLPGLGVRFWAARRSRIEPRWAQGLELRPSRVGLASSLLGIENWLEASRNVRPWKSRRLQCLDLAPRLAAGSGQ